MLQARRIALDTLNSSGDIAEHCADGVTASESGQSCGCYV